MGKNYFGSAKQQHKPTVQGLVESCVLKVTKENAKIETKLMSRTDKCVNAYVQIMICKSEENLLEKKDKIKKLVNLYSEGEVIISNIVECEDFNLRKIKKTYLYKVSLVESGPLRGSHAFFKGVEKETKDSFKNLLGLLNNREFDYSVLCKKIDKNNRPTMQTLSVEVEEVLLDKLVPTLNIYISGRCFLYKQVRLIVGTLAQLTRKGIKSVEKEDLERYKSVAPGEGLYLHSIVL